jgi:hypothetical protein
VNELRDQLNLEKIAVFTDNLRILKCVPSTPYIGNGKNSIKVLRKENVNYREEGINVCAEASVAVE